MIYFGIGRYRIKKGALENKNIKVKESNLTLSYI